MDIAAGVALAVLIFAVLGKVLSLPFRIVWKLITNSVVGAIILWVIDLFGAGIEINFLRALIAGFFGIPGVIVLLLERMMGMGFYQKDAENEKRGLTSTTPCVIL